METASLWNQTDYSDITITFSGRSVHCHKIVLCRASDYFNRQSGPRSQFAERSLKEVELKDDDPDALEALLLHLYQQDFDPDVSKSWRFYLDLRAAADKYLLPRLGQTANSRFQRAATRIKDTSEIVIILRALDSELSRHEGLTHYRNTLRRANFEPLLQCAEYRAYVDENTALLWRDLDDLRSDMAALKKEQWLSKNDVEEQSLHLCKVHEAAVTDAKSPVAAVSGGRQVDAECFCKSACYSDRYSDSTITKVKCYVAK
ncbi:hypothetical protein LTR95_003837 [Oleoguttula sp. CCFEE 5521]